MLKKLVRILLVAALVFQVLMPSLTVTAGETENYLGDSDLYQEIETINLEEEVGIESLQSGFPQSGITLPNRRLTDVERMAWIAEYDEMGGAFAFELNTIDAINQIRNDQGLVPVQPDPNLMLAARFSSQAMITFGGTTADPWNIGPYGSVFNIAGAFNAPAGLANMSAGTSMPFLTIANILNPEMRYIGIGSHAGGAWGAMHTIFLSEASASAFPNSNINLPNRRLTDEERACWIAEYLEMSGLFDFELAAIDLVNAERASYGLAPLQLDITLAMAARFYAQIMANLDTPLGHHEGPYGGSAGVGEAFGAPGSWRNGQAGSRTPAALVQAWMNSPGHRENLLRPYLNYIGLGSHLGGRNGVFHYKFMTTTPATLSTDPNLCPISTYTVIVENGTGSGDFEVGATVTIIAEVPTGYTFVRWDSLTAEFYDVNNPTTTFVMPASDVTVRAIFEAESFLTCPVIAEGQFGNQEGENAIAGAPWRVCEEGTLEVEEGFINWYAPPSLDGSYSAVSPWHEYRDYINRVVFKGEVLAGTSLGSLFSNLTQVTEIEGLTYFDTTNVRNMSWMFNQANSLTELDLSSFDTSQVTTMNRMFRGTSSLMDLDIGHFSTSNVVDMGWMFFGASNLVELDVSNFNTSNVINMGLMFREMSSLVELDVSNFDTGNVLDMREMFRGTRLTQLNLSSFNTSQIVNMNHMFTGMNLLTELTLGSEFSFIGNAGLPTIRQTESYTGLWQGPSIAFTSTQLMAQFDGNTMAGTFVWQEWTVPVTCEIVARGRFANGITVAGSEWRLCENGTLEVDEGFINWISNLSPWNAHRSDINQIVFTGPITAGSSLRGLFRELTELTEIEGLTYFDTSATWDMHRMFFGASSLTAIDVTSFDTSNVTDMALMFREATRLVDLDVSGFNTGNVVDMREMFRGTQIVHLDLTGFDTSSIVNMNLMFTGMTSLRRLTLGSEFSFIGSPGLPGAGGGQVGFTNRWQNVGNGTAANPTGQFVFTTTQLMTQFNGSTMADTFVWQPR